jgi:hypothetical protein
MRDDFTRLTTETIAKRAGYVCSNPDCGRSTVGAAPGHSGSVNIGVAAHITAAAPGGPRYDAFLTRDQRRHQLNGIWLCQTHGKLVDSDGQYFTVEMLRNWKRAAETQSFHSIVGLGILRDDHSESAAVDLEDLEPVSRLGLAAQEDPVSVTFLLLRAAQADLLTFKSMPGWPAHPIALNLRMIEGESVRPFNVSALATAIDTFNEIVVLAPPGTGKTTTLIQVTEAILSQGNSVAAFIPLGEWSSQTESLFQSVVRRRAFLETREEHLKLLAHFGRFVLVMDGWNELDSASRRRASDQIKSLHREYPNLRIIVSSRRQELNVPISGPMVEIDALAEGQQLEIARALRGSQGAVILDQAWRTSGLRELVAIPLYLTALLTHTPSESSPTTKEEVLRLFVTEHERTSDKAEALRASIFGFHMEILSALAGEATRAASTAISDSRARAVVRQIEDSLFAGGQITGAPQPAAVLDILVSHHSLVRSHTDPGVISFQHQQFQEWYASFEVEGLMRATAAGSRDTRHTLRAEVLNMPAWEESILFACERLSRTDRMGSLAVAESILEAIAIDPMLAAEMIHRASADVWSGIANKIVDFVGAWHTSGKVDRAVHFMISTGRPEFARHVWPLISDADSQVHLAALRAGRRFRPSVLGADIGPRIAPLPEELREHIISEIATEGDVNGLELAAKLAQTDSSLKVQASVIEALHFRRADRFVAEILHAAPEKLWQLLARQGYAEELGDPAARTRMRHERQRYMDEEPDPLRKLRVLIDMAQRGVAVGSQIRNLIEAVDFPEPDQEARWIIDQAYKLYPNDVAAALVHRLESDRDIPFRTEGLIQAAGITVDAGPLVVRVLNPTGTKRVAEAAVSIVGPQTVLRLVDVLIAIDKRLRSSSGPADEAVSEEYYRLSRGISRTGTTSFIRGLLDRPATDEPREIALLADLVARHGNEAEEGPLQLDDSLYNEMIAAVRQWSEVLLASPAVSRAQLASLAGAIERIAAPQLVPALKLMLAEDLARWRHAREEFTAARSRLFQSDAQHSWTLQYRRAFGAIGDEQVVECMTAYLSDDDFGFDAACALKVIWDRKHSAPRDKRLQFWPDFSAVKIRRMDRQKRASDQESSPFTEVIIQLIDKLVKPGSSDSNHRHALQLAKIAFSMPYRNHADTINTLLQLPQPSRTRQELLSVLVSAGESLGAEMVLEGITTLLEEAKTNPWRLDENRGELDGWLALLPFSDRPMATSDALDLLEANLRQPWRLRHLLSALGDAPSVEAEQVLRLLVEKDPRFLTEHGWLAALDKRGTESAARMLLELICGDTFVRAGIALDRWTLSERLANGMRAHADFRAEVYRRYKSLPPTQAKFVLEHAIAEVADTEGVMLLVRDHVALDRPFDGLLRSAITHAATGQRPSADWVGANEVFSVPIPELRKRLFGMIQDNVAVSRLASQCLAVIDELREDYGPPESEPRHPDIDSGRPWPLVAGNVSLP